MLIFYNLFKPLFNLVKGERFFFRPYFSQLHARHCICIVLKFQSLWPVIFWNFRNTKIQWRPFKCKNYGRKKKHFPVIGLTNGLERLLNTLFHFNCPGIHETEMFNSLIYATVSPFINGIHSLFTVMFKSEVL